MLININPLLRRALLAPELLLQSTDSEAATTAKTAIYRLSVPDSRLVVCQSIFFVPLAGSTIPAHLADAEATLWVSARVHDWSGLLGYQPRVTNIFGTQTAPESIMGDDGITGWSLETKGTMADYLEGSFTADCNGAEPPLGSYWVSASFQPLPGWTPTDSEWKAAVAGMNLVARPA